MRVMVYGAGAMGTILGAYMAKSGIKADLVTRNEEHVAAMNKGGAHVTGTVDFTAEVNAMLPRDLDGLYDVVFLMTKQSQNQSILAALLPHLAADGVVCTTQNGLPEPSVAEVVGQNRCLGCAVSWGATFVGSGESRLTTATDALQFALGSLYNGVNSKKLKEVSSILSCMGKVTVERNFIGARWIKLAINCACSSLSAMSGLTFGEVAKGKLSRRAALELFNEAIAAGRACGIEPQKIQGHDVAKLLAYKSRVKRGISLRLLPVVMKNHRALQSGMLFDLQKGKQCEVGYINGVVISYGKRANYATPFNSLAVDIIKGIERGERGITPDNIELFKKLLM